MSNCFMHGDASCNMQLRITKFDLSHIIKPLLYGLYDMITFHIGYKINIIIIIIARIKKLKRCFGESNCYDVKFQHVLSSLLDS